MEALKNIEASDKDEKACLGFLTHDKTNWEIKEKTDEYKLSYGTINMENPLTNAPEETICFCLEVTLKKPVETVLKCLNDYNIRKTFDTLYNDGKLISEKLENPEVYVYYLFLKMGFVFSNRDFVVQKKLWKDYKGNKDHHLIHIASINHPDYPEKSDPVRGVFLNRAAYLTPGKNEKETSMTLCNCINMKMINVGSFMAVSKGTDGMKKWLAKFKETLEKH
jgi:hypothetical protein